VSQEKEQNGLTIFFIFVKSSPKSQNENRCTGRRHVMKISAVGEVAEWK
jgi:hypothetical protein